MKLKFFFCLFLAIGVVFAETEEPEKKKTTTAEPPSSTTTELSSTTPLPPKPSPSPPKPSPTPTIPTPTSPTPSTTPSPTPPPTTPSPTTPAPSPPTPAPSTPSPQPPTTPVPPTPPPKEYFWNVTDSKGRNCILAKADISLELKYTNTTKHKVIKTLTIPHNATNSGKCGNTTQILSIIFDGNKTLDFEFSKTDDKEGFHVATINSTIVVEDDVVVHLGFTGLNAFKTKLNTSYDCPWSEPATLEPNDGDRNNTEASLRVVLHNIRVEAFRNSTDNNEYSKAYSCANDSPDIVPIMVGIALGILVVVVLIAYVVGRRNTQAQGYLSM